MKPLIAVVGARLNSSRLPKKQLLDLAGQPLIAQLFRRLESVVGIDQIVLATTADSYNQPLVAWAQENGKQVFAFAGDVNDLVGRVDALVREKDPAAVLYVCGDSPLVEPSTIARMIAAWRADPEAMIAHPAWTFEGRPYIHEGFELFSRAAWERLARDANTALLREHVGASLRPFYPQIHSATFVDEPIFYRLKHRLSVDTLSDYRFMSEVYRRWYQHNPPETLVSLAWLIGELEQDPELRQINQQVQQRKAQENSKKAWIVTPGDAESLCEAIRFARDLQDRLSIGVRLLVLGEPEASLDLALLPHAFFTKEALNLELEKARFEHTNWIIWQQSKPLI